MDELKIFLKENSSIYKHKTSKEKQSEKIIIQSLVNEIRSDLDAINIQVNNILIDSCKTSFEIEMFFENLKDKTEFAEINPKTQYYQEKENERIREVEKLKLREEKKRKLIEYINDDKREFVKSMYLNGPEDIEKLKILYETGYDLSDSIIPISRMIEKGRTREFLQFLIKHGLILTQRDLIVMKKKGFLNSSEFMGVVLSSKQIDNELVKQLIK